MNEGLTVGGGVTVVGLALALALLGGCAQGGVGEESMVDAAAVQYPALDLMAVPALGSAANLGGRAYGADPAAYAVAVYIRVGGGWWTKPSFAAPLTPLAPDRTFTCDITTGGQDAQADRLAAFLVPKATTPPAASGQATLPVGLEALAVARVEWVREEAGSFRVLQFAGREWAVKDSGGAVFGPGPNYFSASALNVWVDPAGKLHLRLARRDARWTCAEVIARQSLGYGKYTWFLDSRVDNLDPNVVLGLFTWDDAPEDNHREIDLEFARWGNAADPTNAQYVVQPHETPGNLLRFTQPTVTRSTHSFHWQAARIFFKSVRGPALNPADPGLVIKTWAYRGADIPAPGAENARMNLWLRGGLAPTNGAGIEVVIRGFRFTTEG